jgi:hypothetical protein
LAKYKRDPGGKFKSKGFNDGELSEVALLGAVRKEGKVPDLLYAVTSHQPKKAICNIIQVSGAILGQSRSIFFGKILLILRAFHPGFLEIAYCGEFYTHTHTHTHTHTLGRHTGEKRLTFVLLFMAAKTQTVVSSLWPRAI